MAIITISRGSYSMGKDVAEGVAERLGYECISREVLLEASDMFNIPELKLTQAVEDAPSFLERVTHGKQKYLAYIQSAFTRHVCKDNIVYHGLAGHILLKNVSHILKVRITADVDRRVDMVLKLEGISAGEARAMVEHVDKERRRWTKKLYGLDPEEPLLYDLNIKIHTFDVSDAIDLICQSASMKHFTATPESQKAMEDLALACQVKAALIEKFPNVHTVSDYGNILIYNSVSERRIRDFKSTVMDIISGIDGINNVEVHAGVSPPPNAV